MISDITKEESSALYGLLAESSTDIILKTDCDGFIRHASPAIERLGFPLPDMLIWPHILDLVDNAFEPPIRAAHQAAISGRQSGRWIEFCSVTNDNCREKWFAIRIGSLIDDRGRIYGALSVMRNIEETMTLKEELFKAELTDPLTGLTNRRAFISMLQYLVDCRARGCLALFDIDYFKAINMRYGQSTGDKVLVAFADILRRLTDADHIISRVGAQRFGILLPEATPDRAWTVCVEIASILAELGQSDRVACLPITTSAGVASIDRTLDATIKAAELSLFLAKAKGSNTIEMASR